MKRDKINICRHDWEDLYEFRTIDHAKFLQQRCKKCNETRYIQLEKPSDETIKMAENLDKKG